MITTGNSVPIWSEAGFQLHGHQRIHFCMKTSDENWGSMLTYTHVPVRSPKSLVGLAAQPRFAVWLRWPRGLVANSPQGPQDQSPWIQASAKSGKLLKNGGSHKNRRICYYNLFISYHNYIRSWTCGKIATVQTKQFLWWKLAKSWDFSERQPAKWRLKRRMVARWW